MSLTEVPSPSSSSGKGAQGPSSLSATTSRATTSLFSRPCSSCFLFSLSVCLLVFLISLPSRPLRLLLTRSKRSVCRVRALKRCECAWRCYGSDPIIPSFKRPRSNHESLSLGLALCTTPSFALAAQRELVQYSRTERRRSLAGRLDLGAQGVQASHPCFSSSLGRLGEPSVSQDGRAYHDTGLVTNTE